ncbi:MAG: hypothetical protein AAGK97_15180, partial [Bacteroidota bacterium]
MKPIHFILLLFFFSWELTSQSLKEETLPVKQQVENLSAFSKLYGYVRYFHPSDECSSIDWEKFIYYGCEQVLNSPDANALKTNLESLFQPIAPSLVLFTKNDKSEKVKIEPLGESLVYWQHRGISITDESAYGSVRIGRIDPEEEASDGMYKE